jgi:hypothetical protein
MRASTMFVMTALAATVAAGAVAASPSTDPCFLQRNINGFAAPNDRTLYVRVGVRDVWRLDLMTDCTGLTFRNSLALQGSPTGPWICHPLEATVINRQGGFPMRCPVSALHKLTPDEIAAIPKRDRP